jgi:SAM-dependent methyltransferase
MKAKLLSDPSLYHYARQIATGGMPFRRWVGLYGLNDPGQRIADLGCGPADVLRYLHLESLPGFYLGLDLSERYLEFAEKRARALGLEHEFMRMDLDRLTTDPAVAGDLEKVLAERMITRVLLLGVIHHVSDDAARATLDLAFTAPTVQSVITSDVVYLPGHRLNNKMCDMDRGEFVRDEPAYDTLVRGSRWPVTKKSFTSPRFSYIRYIHYSFARSTHDDGHDAGPQTGSGNGSAG